MRRAMTDQSSSVTAGMSMKTCRTEWIGLNRFDSAR
jgi:hypothetical protein